jgi:hypothetical protein
VLFEPFARPLLLAHAVLGFVALGAATHLAAYALLAARRGRGLPQLRRFSLLSPLALVAQVLLGLALYPTYRVRVRLEDFERAAPAVAQLFDFKEHLAALAVALIVAAAASARAGTAGTAADLPAADAADLPKEAWSPAKSARWAVAVLSTSGAALTWIAALIGLYVTARHPVGTP